MLLAGIRANSIHSLWSRILCLMAMDFLLAGDRAIRRGEGCSGIDRPLARFELERTREQKNLISQSVRPGVDILSRFLSV